MSRDHLSHARQEAARILDMVRAGLDVPDQAVTWALIISGDLTDIDSP